jgi:copper chaperone CopZ
MKRRIGLLIITITFIVFTFISLNLNNDAGDIHSFNESVTSENNTTITLMKGKKSLNANKHQKKIVINDLGLTWGGCRAAVAATLKKTEGISASSVDLKRDSATIVYDPKIISLELIKSTIEGIGFNVGKIEEFN